MSNTATEQTTEQPPAQQEAEHDKNIDARFGKIEHEQAEQRGMIEQIRDAVTGGRKAETAAHDKAQARTEDLLANPPAETVAEQVRKAVEQVGAEAAARERQAAHDQEHQRLKEHAERQPREQVSGWRGKLQKAMFGGDPQ